MQVEGVKEPEVDKAKDSGVELDKDGHQPHVDAGGLREAKAVRHNPCHSLTFYLCLENKVSRRGRSDVNVTTVKTWK